VAERVQAILASKNLTLYQISQRSIALYGRSSPFFVPHNLYYDLRGEKFSPSIYQILTFSRISGFRFRDWLGVFGFDLEDISRLQVALPRRRTIVLDVSLTDGNEWTRWVRNRASDEPIPPIAPLSRLLEFTPPRRIASLPRGRERFLYAKIGREDALAFPDLVPGSIVRVNPALSRDFTRQRDGRISDRFFLIEHSRGFCCCRVRFLASGLIVPVDHGLPFAQVELRVPEEARIWGVVDLEFRPVARAEEPEVPRDLARRWRPQLLSEAESVGRLLKSARLRSRFSTREAAQMSQSVADLLKDDRYIISSSSLSDYELRNTPPRDFHKIIALCSIYGLSFESVMGSIGVEPADSGTEVIPDRYLYRVEPRFAVKRGNEVVRAGFLEKLLALFENEVPFFLRDLLGYFSGSAQVTIDDLHWIGGDRDPLHPYLATGILAIVNRRRKTPLHFSSKPVWKQPIYVVLARDGKYLAACCGIEDDKLVIHPYGPDFHSIAEYRHHRDAEVIGQIVAIARRFS
jgi:transcriptional regulator with XRE-family HTH domain